MPRRGRAKSPPGCARGPTARGLQHKGGPMAPPDADPARPLGEPWGKPSQRALRPCHPQQPRDRPLGTLSRTRGDPPPAPRPGPAGPPTRAAGAPFSLLSPSFLHSREWGRQHSARDPAPQEPWRPKGGAGTRPTARPGLGPDTVTGEGEEKGRTRARSSKPRRGGKKSSTEREVGRRLRGGGTRTKRGPESVRAEEGTGSGKGAPTETRAGPPGKHARDPTATSTRAVPRRPQRQPASAPLASLPTSQAPPHNAQRWGPDPRDPRRGSPSPTSIHSVHPGATPQGSASQSQAAPTRARTPPASGEPGTGAGGRQPPLARRRGGRGAQGRPKPLGTHTPPREKRGDTARMRARPHTTRPRRTGPGAGHRPGLA